MYIRKFTGNEQQKQAQSRVHYTSRYLWQPECNEELNETLKVSTKVLQQEAEYVPRKT